MNLEDFVSNYMNTTNNKNKLEDVIKLIENEARKKAKGGCACLSEEEVEKIIDNSTKMLKEKNATSAKVETKSVAKPKPQAKTNTSKESNNDSEFDFSQLGLF